MGVNAKTPGERYDPNRLSQRIERESLQGGFWTRFLRENHVERMGTREALGPVGDVGSEDGRRRLKMSGAVIETVQDLQKGGTTVDVPIKLRLFKDPISGRTGMQGTGEGTRWLWRQYKIWNYKKTVALVAEGSVDDQILTPSMVGAINDEAIPALKEYWRDWTEGDIPYTLLTGYSANMTALKDIEGHLSQTPFSPGNFFVAAHGEVQYDLLNERPGTAGYEAKLAAAVNAMMAKDPSIAGLTPRVVRAFRADAARRNIGKLLVPGGKSFYILVVKDSQWAQLENHPDFRNEINAAMPRDEMNNPLFADVVAVYAQCLIYVNPGQFGIQTVNGVVQQHSSTDASSEILKYGPTGSWVGETGQYASLDQNECALAMIVGPYALAKMYGKTRFEITKQEWNHGERKEIGMRAWCSFARPDAIDNEAYFGYGANAYLYNDSFAVLATRSPIASGYSTEEV